MKVKHDSICCSQHLQHGHRVTFLVLQFVEDYINANSRILSFERRAKDIIEYNQRKKKQVNVVNI